MVMPSYSLEEIAKKIQAPITRRSPCKIDRAEPLATAKTGLQLLF